MGWPVAAAIVGGSVLSSMMGNQAAKEESEAARSQASGLRQEALAELSKMNPIQLAELGYDPAMIEYIKGPQPLLYSPAEEVQANMISTDPATRAIQMQALEEMGQRAEEGLSAQDRYNFMKNRRLAETSARGQEEAIIANLAQRGMGGTGIEAALRMMASQGGSERLAEQQAMEAAENAKMRLAATGQQAGLAGDIRQQDIGVARSNADILNQLAWNNSERARQIENMNIDMQNRAAQEDVATRRGVQAANVTTQNQAQLMNKQQAIQNQLAKQESERQTAMARAGALTSGIPDIYASGAAGAAGARQMWDTIGAGVGTAGQMYMTQQAADQASRDRAADRQMMGQIYGAQPPPKPTGNPYTYNYTGPSYSNVG